MPSFANTPYALVITRPDLGAASPLTFTEAAGEMRLTRGGAAPLPLTTAELVVSSTSIMIVPAAFGMPTSVQVMYKIADVPFVFKTYLH